MPAGNVHPLDGLLSDAELATVPTAYATALRMLHRARVAAGETVLVTGASGGVGSALVQLARIRGARALAVAAATSTRRSGTWARPRSSPATPPTWRPR